VCLVDGLALVDQVIALQSLWSVGTGVMTLSMSYTFLVLVGLVRALHANSLKTEASPPCLPHFQHCHAVLCFALVNVLCTDDVPLILSLPTSAPATSYSSVLVFSSPCYGTTANRAEKNVEFHSTNSGFTKCPEREAMSVASKTLVVYAPYAQRLNSRCRSSLCSQM
jgi:hypothetical protein